MVILREGETVSGKVRLRGETAYVTNTRVILVKDDEEKLSIPLDEIKSVELRTHRGFLIVALLGALLLIFSLLVPSVCTVNLPSGSTCTEIGLIKQCPHEPFSSFSCFSTWWIIFIAIPIIWYGYTHLWRLDIITRHGTLSIMSTRKPLEELATAIMREKMRKR